LHLNVNLRLTPESARLFTRLGVPVTDGVVSTTGRTVIDMSQHALSYVLPGQPAVRPPTHPLDLNLPRYWEAGIDTLTLRTRDEKGTVLSVSVWKKN
jgi:hypothetical protein